MTDIFNRGLYHIVNQDFTYATDVIKIALLDGYTFDATHNVWTDVSASEITATDYPAGGQALDNIAVTEDDANGRAEVDADDEVFVGIGGVANDTFTELILWNDSGPGPDDLIAHFDVSSTTTNDGDITLVWNAEGILQFA